MALIVWTDAAPVDNVTTLTAARWEQLKTNITAQVNGALDDANLGTITVASLGQPNAYYTMEIPLLYETAGTLAGVSAGLGVIHNRTVDFPFGVQVASTLIAVETTCIAAVDTGGGTNDARVRNVTTGSDVSGTTTVFNNAASNATAGLSVSLSTSVNYAVRVTTATTSGDGVAGGIVRLHLKAVHQG